MTSAAERRACRAARVLLKFVRREIKLGVTSKKGFSFTRPGALHDELVFFLDVFDPDAARDMRKVMRKGVRLD